MDNKYAVMMDLPATTEAADASSGPPPPNRRGFFRWFTAICGAVAAVVLSIPLVGYFFNVRKRTAPWVDLGPVADFPLKVTRRVDFVNPLQSPWDGVTALTGVYARNEGKGTSGDDRFLILSVYCAHLGCPVSWFPQSGLFMCPCHGGVYYENGERASGPPPRGLYRCAWRVRDGRLHVQAPHYPTLQDPLVADG